MITAEVPEDGPLQLASVQLPDGKQLTGSDDSAPLLWASSEPVPDAGQVWRVLTDMHKDTGLVPILLAFLDRAHEGRPWDEGELNDRCDLAAVDRLDAATVLAKEWAGSAHSADELEEDPGWAEMIAPYGEHSPAWRPARTRS